MITIDSQIWIFYLDPLSVENQNVTKWLDGEYDSGILKKEEIGLSAIIPLEIAHTIYKIKHLNQEISERTLLSLISMKNCQILEIDQLCMFNALDRLKLSKNSGIGGRDAIILASMELYQINTIVTHDKGILRIKEVRRIDPVFNPPLILEIGEPLQEEIFSSLLKDIVN